VSMLDEYPNLVILQTMSKAFGAAGLRIGMGIMNSDLVQVLNNIKPPYNISSANQEAALQQLDNITEVRQSIIDIKIERTRLQAELEKLKMVDRIFPSQANFLLIRFYQSRTVLAQLLVNGIVVRDRSSHHNCHDCIRISIGTREENQQLLECLIKIENELL